MRRFGAFVPSPRGTRGCVQLLRRSQLSQAPKRLIFYPHLPPLIPSTTGTWPIADAPGAARSCAWSPARTMPKRSPTRHQSRQNVVLPAAQRKRQTSAFRDRHVTVTAHCTRPGTQSADRSTPETPRTDVKRHRGGADSPSRQMTAGLPPSASDDAPSEARRIAMRARLLGARLLGRTQRVVSGGLEDILDLFEEHVVRGRDHRPTAATSTTPGGRRLRALLGGAGARPARARRASGSRASTATTAPTTSASTSACWSGVGRRGDLPLHRPRRRHAPALGPRPPAPQARRPRARQRHHLRRHRAPREAARAGRGQRALHPAARRRRRARLPRRRLPRRALRGALPGPRRRPPARRRRAGPRDGELGRGGPPRRPRRPTTPSTPRSPRATTPRPSTACVGADGVTRWVHDRAAARRDAPTAASRSAASSPTSPSAAACAPSWRTRTPRVSRVVEAMDGHLYTLRVDERRQPPRRLPRPEPRGAGRRGAAAAGRAPPVRGARAPRRPRAAAGGAGAPARTGEPSSSSTACAGSTAASGSCSDQLRPRRDADGTLFFDGVARDITERRRLEDELLRCMAEMQAAHAELERRARPSCGRTDELTGTCNRRHFAEIVAAALQPSAGGCGAAAARRRPLQARQRRLRPRGRRRGAGGARPPAAATASEPDDCWRAGAARSSRCCCATWASDAELRPARRAAARRRSPRTPVTAAGVEAAADGVGRRGARASGELDTPRRAGRGRRPLPLRRQAPRPQPRLAGAAPARRRRGAASPSPSAWPARWRSSPARARARRAPTPSRSPRSQRSPPSASALPAGVVLRCRLGGWLHDVGKAAIPREHPRQARAARRRGVGG